MAETLQDIKVKLLKEESTTISMRLHEYKVVKKARGLTLQERAEREELLERLYFVNRELSKIKKERRERCNKGNRRNKSNQWRIPAGGFEVWAEPQVANNSEEVHKEKKRIPKVYSHAMEKRFYYHGKMRTTTEIKNLRSHNSVTSSVVTKPRRKRKANPCPNQIKDDSTDKNQKEWKPSPTNKKWKKKWKPNPTKWEPEF